MPSRTLPLRAITRLLAEMQTSIMAVALPLFGGRVDRFMIYSLLVRRRLGGDRPIPTLAIAQSLGLPFETARRHVVALERAALCVRDRHGVSSGPAMDDPPFADLPTLAHDCLVRLIEDMLAIGALPPYSRWWRL